MTAIPKTIELVTKSPVKNVSFKESEDETDIITIYSTASNESIEAGFDLDCMPDVPGDIVKARFELTEMFFGSSLISRLFDRCFKI